MECRIQKKSEDDSSQSGNGESGEAHVLHADNNDSEEKSGRTIEEGSEQVDNGGCEALCIEETEESGHENSSTQNVNQETLLKDIKINVDPMDDPDQNRPSNLKTKHAECMSKIVGITEKVIKFDELRY